MNARNAHHIVLLLALLMVTGCATTRFNVTVQDQAGNAIDRRTLKEKDLPSVLDEMYSSLAQGEYEKCRGLGAVVEDVWPSEQEAVSESARLSAWATLFLYRETPVGLTSLENEKRNLLILHTASSEFSEVNGHWVGEAEVVIKAIDARVLNRQAFDAFVKSMRSSMDASSIIEVQGSRTAAVESVRHSYPDWSRSAGLGWLAEYPWRRLLE